MYEIVKKIVYLFTFVIFISVTLNLVADDRAVVWGGVYTRASTYDQKYEIMQDIVEQDNRELIPVLLNALDELVQERGVFDLSTTEIRIKLIMIIVKELGDLNAENAGPIIYTVVKEADDPYLKGEALIALGKIGARSYAPDIALILRNMNLYRGTEVSGDEAVAYGCIFALEKLRDPIGYIPVLIASQAGYSRRIEKFAAETLDGLADDPSAIVGAYIKNESSLRLKLDVQQAFNASGAPEEKKIKVAIEALNQGLINRPRDIDDETFLREIRVKALEVFTSFGAEHADAAPLIEKILYMDTDVNEKITALDALSNFTSDEAVKVLTRFLAQQNNQQQAGISAPDNRLVMTTIRALSKTGSEIGYEEILRVKFSGFPAIVIREAEKALERFE